MDYIYFVGIDISKHTLDFAVVNSKETLMQITVENSPAGIKNFISAFKKHVSFKKQQVLFCMEHTGLYNHYLLEYLVQNDFALCVEPAVQIKRSMGLQRGKNDRVDALRIARYAYKSREELKLWQPAREIVKKLKSLLSIRTGLIDTRKRLNTMVNELGCFDKKQAAKNKTLMQSTLKGLNNDITKVEKEIDALLKDDPHLRRLLQIITSIKGIGKVTAAFIITTTNEFKMINEASKFACYAGIAPFEHSSGTSIRGRNRVSHSANKQVKTLLHMAAMAAITGEGEMRAYYERKMAENKNKMLIINNIRNKLVARIFSCVKADRIYENNYLQALA